jgi:hypothetical protein
MVDLPSHLCTRGRTLRTILSNFWASPAIHLMISSWTLESIRISWWQWLQQHLDLWLDQGLMKLSGAITSVEELLRSSSNIQIQMTEEVWKSKEFAQFMANNSNVTFNDDDCHEMACVDHAQAEDYVQAEDHQQSVTLDQDQDQTEDHFLNGWDYPLLLVLVVNQPGSNFHYCLVSLMWMKIGSNDITAQVPGVS